MAGLNGGNAANVVRTALDLVFDTEFDYPGGPYTATAENPLVFMQSSTDKAAVITEQFMGGGYWDERAELEPLKVGANKVGNQKTFSVANYSDSRDVSKNLFDDDQHDVVQMMIKSMARNGRLTRDRNAMGHISGGFDTYTTNDSAYIFSASHTTLSGETVSNLVSGALSESTLETAINALYEQKTQDGTIGGQEPQVLLVPPALFKEAVIFTKSELRPTTSNNDMNYVSMVYPGLQVLRSPFLGANAGGSDTAWYLLSRNHSLYRWVRQAIQKDLVDYKFQRNNTYIYKAEYRETVGAISYEGLAGSTGL